MGKERIKTLIKSAKEGKSSGKKAPTIVKDFLIINTGARLIAIQLEYLSEVIELQDRKEIVPIPFIPEYINGILDVRGEIIPVVSLVTIIGEESEEDKYIVGAVIENKIKICFFFLQIVDLITIDIKKIRSIKDVRKSGNTLYFNEEFEYENENVVILDIPVLFKSDYFS